MLLKSQIFKRALFELAQLISHLFACSIQLHGDRLSRMTFLGCLYRNGDFGLLSLQNKVRQAFLQNLCCRLGVHAPHKTNTGIFGTLKSSIFFHVSNLCDFFAPQRKARVCVVDVNSHDVPFVNFSVLFFLAMMMGRNAALSINVGGEPCCIDFIHGGGF
jgi:hypothetical protein